MEEIKDCLKEKDQREYDDTEEDLEDEEWNEEDWDEYLERKHEEYDLVEAYERVYSDITNEIEEWEEYLKNEDWNEEDLEDEDEINEIKNDIKKLKEIREFIGTQRDNHYLYATEY